MPRDTDTSIDHMFETLAGMKAEADAKITPWQQDLKAGDHFCYMSGTANILIWGEILEDQDDPILHGYRFCECYSKACPDGELGDVHVSVIYKKIDDFTFDLARKQNWPHDEESFLKFAVILERERNSN